MVAHITAKTPHSFSLPYPTSMNSLFPPALVLADSHTTCFFPMTLDIYCIGGVLNHVLLDGYVTAALRSS